ncbi:DUF2254 domain-containing protein [Marixanthomonas ophiurae]|uniref:DUF2254 domain-containing protein n=1 Tax=Marixanthomonas ophiurae TaxID=387659 RepID=A0A3E1Q8X7_9FLAO|nr:DUF2254 family protein [Marixanthomonas ophiurae]RFN58578.1 DUF2254 domain-containing protein [Marixanthomonas ophiurae]
MLNRLKRLIHNIAFVPFLIAFAFGALATVIVAFPIQVKGTALEFLAITDKSNIQTIISFVITGIFTLTVFSYTMVMNVLNRSISNFSPRLIPLLLSQRDHKIILGFTSGTIVYGLVLALFVTNSSEKPFPDLGAALALLFAVICVGIFIYFLHTVSQSIHINYILNESFENTRKNLQKSIEPNGTFLKIDEPENLAHKIKTKKCGYLQNVDLDYLSKLAKKHGFIAKIAPEIGNFVLENETLLYISIKPDHKLLKKIWRVLEVNLNEPMDVPEIGFKHFVEVAIKASSPAINDPGTSLTTIDYITQLFILRAKIKDHNAYKTVNGELIYYKTVPFNKLRYICFTEMKRYMKDDPALISKLNNALEIINKRCQNYKTCNYSDI